MESKRIPLKLAYLLSQYPAVNHVFMLREVCLLRQLGLDIQVASIRDPDRDEGLMTAAEREEVRSTYYVKSAGLWRVALAHAHTLFARPGRYFRGLACALRISPRAIYGFFYFTEAVTVGYWMRRQWVIAFAYALCSDGRVSGRRIFPVTLSITFHGSGGVLKIRRDPGLRRRCRRRCSVAPSASTVWPN